MTHGSLGPQVQGLEERCQWQVFEGKIRGF